MKFILVNSPKLLNFRGEKVAFFFFQKNFKKIMTSPDRRNLPAFHTKQTQSKIKLILHSSPHQAQSKYVWFGIFREPLKITPNNPKTSAQQKHLIFGDSEPTSSPTLPRKSPIFLHVHSKQNPLLFLNCNIFFTIFYFYFSPFHTHFRISFQQNKFSPVATTQYSPTELNSQVFSFIINFLLFLDNIFNFSPFIQKKTFFILLNYHSTHYSQLNIHFIAWPYFLRPPPLISFLPHDPRVKTMNPKTTEIDHPRLVHCCMFWFLFIPFIWT